MTQKNAMDEVTSAKESRQARLRAAVEQVRSRIAAGEAVDLKGPQAVSKWGDLLPALVEELSHVEAGPPVSADGSADEVTHAPSAGNTKYDIPGYKVLREISRGGQAVVFEAVQKSTTRKVAIKIMREGPWATARNRARFDREVQILAALSHPNIVQVLDRGTTGDGSQFLAMPFIDGRTLDQWLAAFHDKHPQGVPLENPAELLRVFLKICDAVNAAHLRGVVHRDLKPSNIRIDEKDEAHILDFGLARTAVSDLTDEETPQMVTLTGEFMGSLPWASPEQAQGTQANVDARSDVYSLGVILYQMLTGKFPYEVAGTMRDVLNNIITAEPMPPSRILSGRHAEDARKMQKRLRTRPNPLNPVIDAIVLKALAKRREDRYQSAGDLARDLANYLSGRPTQAAGAPPRVAQPRWVKASAVAAAVLLCAAIGVGWWLSDRPAKQAHGADAGGNLAGHLAANPTKPDRAPAPTAAAAPDENSMHALGVRVAKGDRDAFDQLRSTAKNLYEGLDPDKDSDRMIANLKLMRAAFEVLGEETGKGNEAAFKAVKRSMKETPLSSFAPDALGIAAAAGHKESLFMLVHPDLSGVGQSSAVFALKEAAAANKEEAVAYLISVLEDSKAQPLWYGASEGLTQAAARGNEKAKLALAQAKAKEQSSTTP